MILVGLLMRGVKGVVSFLFGSMECRNQTQEDIANN
jgi:hypothetical protein